jgi:hypothetical protein
MTGIRDKHPCTYPTMRQAAPPHAFSRAPCLDHASTPDSQPLLFTDQQLAELSNNVGGYFTSEGHLLWRYASHPHKNLSYVLLTPDSMQSTTRSRYDTKTRRNPPCR